MSSLFASTLPPPSVDLLFAWFHARQIHFDPRLEVRTGLVDGVDQGWGVWARENIEDEDMVCRIPKASIFTHKTSTLGATDGTSLCLPPLTPPTYVLTLHLLHEIMVGERSPWWGYLQSLPRKRIPLAMFWQAFEGDDGVRAWKISKGAELEWRVRQDERGLGGDGAEGGPAGWGAGGLSALKTFFDQHVLRIMAASPHFRQTKPFPLPPSWDTFLHAYSLVSSRAFHIDDYHHVGLVTPADLCNHSPQNNAHFQADEFVCETCGSLLRCSHDGPPSPFFPARLSHLQDLEEKDLLDLFGEEDSVDIVVNQKLIEGQEVFNSYGELSSVRLACEYGFIPPDAMSLPQDRIHITLGPSPSSSHPSPSSATRSLSHPWIEKPTDNDYETRPVTTTAEELYVSPDAQLSRALFASVGNEAFGSEDSAWHVLLDGGKEKAEQWRTLAEAVVKVLEEKIEGLVEKDAPWETLEDEGSGYLSKMAATLVLGERVTLEVCRARWAGEEAEDEDEEVEGMDDP